MGCGASTTGSVQGQSSSGGAVSFRRPTDVHGHQVADSHLSIVLQQLKDQLTGNMDQYRAKILADHVSTLSNLVTVLDLRCKAAPRDCTPSPESSAEKSGAEQLFSTGLDDVEVLYCLFREADRDKNGCISKDELIFMMQMDEHKVMTKVLLQAWECSRGDLMEALAHLEATDFGDHR